MYKSNNVLSDAKTILAGLKRHYNYAFESKDKTEFNKLFCSEYFMLEKTMLTVIKDLQYTDLEKLFFEKVEIEISNRGFTINTDSFDSVLYSLDGQSALNSNKIFCVQSVIIFVALKEIYSCIIQKNQDSERLSACLSTISNCKQIDIEDYLHKHLELERILQKDPTAQYMLQTKKSKALYRNMISQICKKTKRLEIDIANVILDTSQSTQKHIGFEIYNVYNEIFDKKKRQLLYKIIPAIFTVGITVCIAFLLQKYYLLVLLLIPIYEILHPIADFFIQRGIMPQYAPRMDLQGLIPENFKTGVVISTILPTGDDLSIFEKKLDIMMLANDDEFIKFVILADLTAYENQSRSSDGAMLKNIDLMINRLNSLHNNRLLLLVRNREYSKTQSKFIGKNRKQGAIMHLVNDICNANGEYRHKCGDYKILENISYILALDFDTNLQIDSVYDLICVAAHPLNQPVIGIDNQVVSGYGIINPRISLDLKSSLVNRFTKIVGGIGGISSYNEETSELNQVLYDNTIFTGKGLINVQVYNEIMPDIFKNESVLSHDIIEGIYLRTRFVGDIELLDSFPTDITSYFKRLQRWIRGDFQNLQFLSKGINLSDKFKLLGNIRRAIAPIFSLILVLNPSLLIRSIGLLAVIAPFLFSVIIKAICGSITHFTTQLFADDTQLLAPIVYRAFFEIVYLPQYAINAIIGAVKAIYRLYISKKNLLEWDTSSQVENYNKSKFITMKSYFFSIVFSIITILNGGLLVSALFLLSYPFAIYLMKRCRSNSNDIPMNKIDKLSDDMRCMLHFYRDNCDKYNNYLPPDNIQFSPVKATAQRTSPTNIGMMLLSFLAARDFNIINNEMLYFNINQTINSIEKLKKFHGNLYNWYSTVTLEVLPEYFVSTVDSGNFICSLVTLNEGLKEYSIEYDNFNVLIERIDIIINTTDLSVFYNNKKKLFSIGYDTKNNVLSNSHYDMLMSEARMTSYFAIASGQVKKDHWEALDRTLSRQDVFTGAISWTGTMFEYFMPELLLHSIRGSLSHESLQYCIFCQKNRVKGLGIPYGISESAIYSFDSELNYQYNANGVQRLALKSEQNKQLVISPYSTYLTLAHDFDDAYKNLLIFDSINCRGMYGYWESIDYTQSRVGVNCSQIVRSYMAHHIGMSIIAISNALDKNRMQKRFLKNKMMNRAQSLLQERYRIGDVVMLEQIKREEAKNFMLDLDIDEYVGELHPSNPRVKLLNNGDISAVLTDIGVSSIIKQQTNISRHTSDIYKNPLGTFSYINTDDGIVSLTYAPSYDANIAYETSWSFSKINYYAKGNGISSKISVSLCQTISCEIRKVSVTNKKYDRLETSIITYLEPALLQNKDYDSHKAFSKLFLNITYDESSKIIVVSRKKRGTHDTVFMAVGLDEDVKFDFLANRENLFERNNITRVKHSAFTDEFKQSTGVPDPIVAVRIPVCIRKNGSVEYNMFTSVGTTKQEVIDNIILARQSLNNVAFVGSRFKNDSLQQRILQVILPQILYKKFDSTRSIEAKNANELSYSTLYKYSISGIKPILLVELIAENCDDRVIAYIDCFNYLRVCGIVCDIIFLCESDSIISVANNIIAEKNLQGTIGDGLFLIDRNNINENEKTLIYAVACHIATRSLIRIETPLVKYSPIKIQKVLPDKLNEKATLLVKGGFFTDDSFVITESPSVPWCHVLSNATFGTLLSDKSLGFTWAINSRQNKLTEWSNDTMMDNIGEKLVVKAGENYYNIIDGSIAKFSPNSAQYYCKFDCFTCGTTVTIPNKGMIKYVEVELKNTSEVDKEIDLSYFVSPVLGVDKVNSRLLKTEKCENIMVINNPNQFSGNSFMGITPYCSNFNYVCDRVDFDCGNWNKNSLGTTNEDCVAISLNAVIKPNETRKLTFAIAFSTTKSGLLKLVKLSPTGQYESERKIRIKTSQPQVDLMVNTWLPHQIISGRIQGRTGFYQCGGAYGFRDQLQDISIYCMLSSKIAKTHIIRCCASQFEEGDVLHWWHNMPKFGGGKKGIRSHYSDDLVWLAYTVCCYVKITGDVEITSTMVKYLTAPPLGKDEKDRYLDCVYTDYKESVYEHCKRALNHAYNLSDIGLVKIGGGDWNDGYSNVGINGSGQSVWLTQFLALTLKKFAILAEKLGDKQTVDDCVKKAEILLKNVDKNCYDEDHYIRAIYDDGEKMGAYSSDECKLDSLTQSFACLAEMHDEIRVSTALDTAYELLVDQTEGIIKLFYPPFDKSLQEPGYVKSYPRGVRENGGQYTHAAIWFAIAMKKAGKYEQFYKMAEMLNPINKYMHSNSAKKYKVEPYYISADIYTNENAYGRGGWTIYTGSAAWYYNLLVTHMLGINIENDKVEFNPSLPKRITGLYVEILQNGELTTYKK